MKDRLDWPPRVEGDSKLNPIIPLLEELYEATQIREDLTEERLKKLGDALIPHAQDTNQTISIGDFIQIDDSVSLKKLQYWSFEIEKPSGTDEPGSRFRIERTDAWNGSGVNLKISMHKGEDRQLEVNLEKWGNKYYIFLQTSEEGWKEFSRASKKTATWKKEQ